MTFGKPTIQKNTSFEDCLIILQNEECDVRFYDKVTHKVNKSTGEHIIEKKKKHCLQVKRNLCSYLVTDMTAKKLCKHLGLDFSNLSEELHHSRDIL